MSTNAQARQGITWYDGPDGEYVAVRNDGWIVACDDHSTWIFDEPFLEDTMIKIDFEHIDPGFSHRILTRFEIIDRVSRL